MGGMDTDKKWARRVARWQSSGLTSTEFCAGREYTPGGLRYWAHRLRQHDAATARPEIAQPALHLVRVERAPVSVDAPAVPAAATRSDSTLTIELGGARVAVPAGFDAATLRAVLDALAPKVSRSRR